MNNQKYIISILLVLIFILLGFTTYLLFGEKTTNKEEVVNTNQKTYIGDDTTKTKAQENKEAPINKVQPTEPEVYLGENLKIPSEIGCVFVKDTFDGPGINQQTIRDSLTKEVKTVLNYYVQSGWMFNQVCKASDFSVAYSMYSEERSKKNLSNSFIVAFIESDKSLRYYLDERINKLGDNPKICSIYKMTEKNVEFSCDTKEGIKKYNLPFSQEEKVYEIK